MYLNERSTKKKKTRLHVRRLFKNQIRESHQTKFNQQLEKRDVFEYNFCNLHTTIQIYNDIYIIHTTNCTQ